MRNRPDQPPRASTWWMRVPYGTESAAVLFWPPRCNEGKGLGVYVSTKGQVILVSGAMRNILGSFQGARTRRGKKTGVLGQKHLF